MSNPIGIVMGQFCTPFIVKHEDDVPLMNIIWFIPAGLGALLTIWKVTSNVPPTPPSPSAAQAMQQKSSKRGDYWGQVKKILQKLAFYHHIPICWWCNGLY